MAKSTKQLARQLGLLRKRPLSSSTEDPKLRTKKKTKICQPFSYLIVIDFESTCWEGDKASPQEIIEFPAVLLNSFTGEIESEFHHYLQPSEKPFLSAFCQRLTGITQEKVDNGIPLSLCLRKFSNWLKKLQVDMGIFCADHKNLPETDGHAKVKTAAIVTWSDWDLGVCLLYEARRKQITRPLAMNTWIDLRITYRKFYERSPDGLNGALKDLGIVFDGREHSGVDDARNTARLAWRMICDGCTLNITKTLKMGNTGTTERISFPPSTQMTGSYKQILTYEHNGKPKQDRSSSECFVIAKDHDSESQTSKSSIRSKTTCAGLTVRNLNASCFSNSNGVGKCEQIASGQSKKQLCTSSKIKANRNIDITSCSTSKIPVPSKKFENDELKAKNLICNSEKKQPPDTEIYLKPQIQTHTLSKGKLQLPSQSSFSDLLSSSPIDSASPHSSVSEQFVSFKVPCPPSSKDSCLNKDALHPKILMSSCRSPSAENKKNISCLSRSLLLDFTTSMSSLSHVSDNFASKVPVQVKNPSNSSSSLCTESFMFITNHHPSTCLSSHTSSCCSPITSPCVVSNKSFGQVSNNSLPFRSKCQKLQVHFTEKTPKLNHSPFHFCCISDKSNGEQFTPTPQNRTVSAFSHYPKVSASKPSLRVMNRTPPLCSCGRRSKRLLVQSIGPNLGRNFFTCSIHSQAVDVTGKRKGCSFFQWETSSSDVQIKK